MDIKPTGKNIAVKGKKEKSVVDMDAIQKSATNLVNFLAEKGKIAGNATIKGVMKDGKKYERSFGVFEGTKHIGTYSARGDRAKRFFNPDGLSYFDL